MQKTCRHGCGPLIAEPDFYLLPGIALNPDPKLRVVSKYAVDEDRAFVVRLLVCKTCGYVELEDSE